MIEGSDALDATSCDTLQADLAASTRDTSLTLVRNPDYDPATDTTEARENLPDRFEFRINTNVDDIYDKIDGGRDRGRDRQRAAEGAPRVHAGRGAPAVPARQRRRPHLVPHDEPDAAAVRRHPRAQGRELRHGQGGPAHAPGAARCSARSRRTSSPTRCSTTRSPTTRPYRATGDAGDVAAAKDEMKQSKYDTDKDGICDAPECKDVLTVHGDRPAAPGRWCRSIEASLEKIGITLETRARSRTRTRRSRRRRQNVPISGAARLGQGLRRTRRRSIGPLFDGRSIIADGQHQLLARRRHAASRRKEIRRRGQLPRASRASTPTSTRARRSLGAASASPATGDLDKKLMDGGRAVGSVPLDATATTIIGPERDEVGVRPVRRDDRLRPRGGRRVSAVGATSSRRAAPARGAPDRLPASDSEMLMALHRPTARSGRSSWSSSSRWSRSSSSTCCPAGDPALRFAGQVADARRRSPGDPGAARPRQAVVRRSTAIFVKNFVTGDEYGWPGLGFSYDTPRPGQGRDHRARAADALADRRRRDHLARSWAWPSASSPPSSAARSSTGRRWASRSSASPRPSSGSA